MSHISKEAIEKAKQVLRADVIITIDQLSKLLGCSLISARRRLKEWNAYTCYNQKGRFYTLPDIPKFDEDGLWRYKEAYFTKQGNLKNTIVYLLEKSPKGMNSREIGEIVGLEPSSFMHHFRDIPGLCREKLKGRFIYFSDNTKIYTSQRQRRTVLQQAEKNSPQMPTPC